MRWLAFGVGVANMMWATQPPYNLFTLFNVVFGMWCFALFFSASFKKAPPAEPQRAQYPEHIRKQFPGPWTK